VIAARPAAVASADRNYQPGDRVVYAVVHVPLPDNWLRRSRPHRRPKARREAVHLQVGGVHCVQRDAPRRSDNRRRFAEAEEIGPLGDTRSMNAALARALKHSSTPQGGGC